MRNKKGRIIDPALCLIAIAKILTPPLSLAFHLQCGLHIGSRRDAVLEGHQVLQLGQIHASVRSAQFSITNR